MIKPSSGRQLAIDILERSNCLVQVGAAIEDRRGRIIAWGWNGSHDGWGLCAERHAILRANRKRLEGGTIYVAGKRHRNGKIVPTRPCAICQPFIDKHSLRVVWRNNNGEWV